MWAAKENKATCISELLGAGSNIAEEDEVRDNRALRVRLPALIDHILHALNLVLLGGILRALMGG